MARILVTVPSFSGSIKSLTAEALFNMDAGGNEVWFSGVSGYGVAQARNEMARRAIRNGADFVLMCDSDVIPPKDGLVRLMSHDKDVCMGWTVRGSSDDGKTSVIKFNTPGFGDSYFAHDMDALAGEGTDLLRVKGNGFSFVLIKTDVIKRIPMPLFEFKEWSDGKQMGEDYCFCKKCSDYGIELYVDTRVRCGHIHDRVL